MAYDPADLRLPPWLLHLLDAMVRVRLPVHPNWRIGMTRAGVMMFFSLLGLWSAAFYSGNNLLYLCGGMLSGIAMMALFQGVQVLRRTPKLGGFMPPVLECQSTYVWHGEQSIPTSISATLEAQWLNSFAQARLRIAQGHCQWRKPLHPTQRGIYHGDKQQLTTDAPLGLWALEYQRQDPFHCLVMPQAIAWQGAQSYTQHGISTQRVDGDEYDDLRTYVAGDPIARIHWRKSTQSPETWRIKRFSQSHRQTASHHLTVDLRLPPQASHDDFERLLGMAWYWLQQHENMPDSATITIGQQSFAVHDNEQRQAAMQALAQARIQSQAPSPIRGAYLSLCP